MDLIARRAIRDLEGKEPDKETLKEYTIPGSEKYENMLEWIRKELHFTSLKYLRLDDMIASTGMDSKKLCTYCWNGEE